MCSETLSAADFTNTFFQKNREWGFSEKTNYLLALQIIHYNFVSNL